MSFFKNLFHRETGLKPASRPRSLHLENLEERTLLSVNAGAAPAESLISSTFDAYPAAAAAPEYSGASAVVETASRESLQNAVNAAVNSGGGTVTFASGINYIKLDKTITITGNVTIDASSVAGGVTLDGQGYCKVVDIADTAGSVTLNNLVITNGNCSVWYAAGIESRAGSLTLNNCLIHDNHGNGFGTAVSVVGTDSRSVSANLNNCTIVNNSSTSFTGGVQVQYGTLNINGCIIAGNSSANAGLENICNNGTMNVTKLITEAGTYNGTYSNVIHTAEPDFSDVFNDYGAGDYSLTENSIARAVNGGGTVKITDRDLAGELRTDSTSDSGCYQVPAPPAIESTDVSISGAGTFIYAGGVSHTVTASITNSAVTAAGGTVRYSYSSDGKTWSAPTSSARSYTDLGIYYVKVTVSAAGYLDFSKVETISITDFTVRNGNCSGAGSFTQIYTDAVNSGLNNIVISFDTANWTLSAGGTYQIEVAETLNIGQEGKSITVDASNIAGGIVFNANGNCQIMKIDGGNVTLKNLVITGGDFQDDVGIYAGGIYATAGTTLSIYNSLFYDNRGSNGSAICAFGTTYLYNCTVTRNHSDGWHVSGGINNVGTMYLYGCIVIGNSADYFYDVCNNDTVNVERLIVTDKPGPNSDQSYSYNYTNTWTGTGNIVGVPEGEYKSLFQDYDGGNFRLSASSKARAVNGGGTAVTTSKDLDGCPRTGTVCDSGCYQYQMSESCSAEFSGETVVYNGTAQLFTVTPHPSNAEVTYSLNGTDYYTRSAFLQLNSTTQSGTYTIYVKVEASGYITFQTARTLTVRKADLTGVSVQSWSAAYDGTGHGVAVTGVPAGLSVLYAASQSGTYSTANPLYKDAGNYTTYVKIAESQNYNAWSGSGTVAVSKAVITVTQLSASDKVYDGSCSAPVTVKSFTGRVGIDNLTVTAEAEYANADAGTKTAAVTAFQLGGTACKNYQLASSGHKTTVSGTITPAPVSAAQFAPVAKTYDARLNAAVTVSAVSGAVGQDSVWIAVDGAYTNADAGTGKTVLLTNYRLVNNPYGNYKLASSLPGSIDSGVITPKTVTLNSVAFADKPYDGTRTAGVVSAVFSGLCSGDQITNAVFTAQFETASVGFRTASVTSCTTNNANYVCSLASGNISGQAEIIAAVRTLSDAAGLTDSLRGAVAAAQNAGTARVYIDKALISGYDTVSNLGTIRLTSTLNLTDLTLDVSEDTYILLDGSALVSSPLLNVTASQSASITRFTFTRGGIGSTASAAVLSGTGTVTFDSCSFISNSAPGTAGGALSVENGCAAAVNCLFTGNSAKSGGAVSVSSSGTFSASNCTFSGNSAVFGGALENWGTAAVTASSFTGNSAENGGAVSNSSSSVPGSGKLTLTGVTLSGNTARCGGALLNSGNAELTNITAVSNSASENGGAVSNTSTQIGTETYFGSLTFCGTENVIGGSPETGNSANSVSGYGGGIFTAKGTRFAVADGGRVTLSGNTAAPKQGADFASDNAELRNIVCKGEILTLLLNNAYFSPAPGTTAPNTALNFTRTVRPTTAALCDIDGDRFVGPGDYSYFQAAWLAEEGDANWDPRADINGDGSVDSLDRALLYPSWYQVLAESDLTYDEYAEELIAAGSSGEDIGGGSAL